MSAKTDNGQVARVLAALGNPTRLELVKRLSLAETFAGQSITELTEATGLSRQAITKHLDALAGAGLVTRRKPGRETWYELETEPLGAAVDLLAKIVEQRAQSLRELNSYRDRMKRRDNLSPRASRAPR